MAACTVVFDKIKTALTDEYSDIKFEVEDITYEPQTMNTVAAEDVARFEKLIDMLNDCDDVQEVYHNAELPSS